MIKHYLKIAFRNILKDKVQNVFNIVGLAIGFACFAVWMIVLNESLKIPEYFPGSERSFSIRNSEKPNRHIIPAKFVRELPSRFPGIEQMAYFSTERQDYIQTSTDGSSPQYKIGYCYVNERFFPFYGEDVLSLANKPESGAGDQIVLSKKTALLLFGKIDPVGSTVYMGSKALVVAAVTDSKSLYPVVDAYWFNEQALDSSYIQVQVKLHQKSSPADFMKEVAKIECVKDNDQKAKLVARPYEMTLDQIVGYGVIRTIITLIGSLILIVALFNYISCVLSRFFKRTKECGIRKINGSGFWDLFGLFFSEILVSLTIAALLSTGLFAALLEYYNSETLHPIAFTSAAKNFIYYFIWGVVLAFFLCIPVVIRVNRMSSYSSITHRMSPVIRAFFICIQLFISSSLLIFSAWLYLQLDHTYIKLFPGLSMKEKGEVVALNPGMLSVIDTELPERLVKQIGSLSDVLAVTQQGQSSQLVYPENSELRISAIVYSIDNFYKDFFKVKLKEGRYLYPDETGSVVINEKLAEKLGNGASVIGTQLMIREGNNPVKPFTIVGVSVGASIVRIMGMSVGDHSCYIHTGKAHYQDVFLKLNGKNYDKSLKAVRQLTNPYMANFSEFRVRSLKETIYDQNGTLLVFQISSLIALVCILLSMLGIWASLSIQAEQRRKEVAIRKVNGAESIHIFILFCKPFIFILLIAWLFSIGLMTIVIPFFSFSFDDSVRYNPNFIFYVAILLISALITMLTIWNKIRTVVKMNPAEVIKAE